MSNKQRLDELWDERQRLSQRVDAIDKERRALRLEDLLAEHPCTCVRKNRDIDVYDMRTAEEAKRNSFGLGFVVELVSADRDCKLCDGDGVPKRAEVEGASV